MEHNTIYTFDQLCSAAAFNLFLHPVVQNWTTTDIKEFVTIEDDPAKVAKMLDVKIGKDVMLVTNQGCKSLANRVQWIPLNDKTLEKIEQYQTFSIRFDKGNIPKKQKEGEPEQKEEPTEFEKRMLAYVYDSENPQFTMQSYFLGIKTEDKELQKKWQLIQSAIIDTTDLMDFLLKKLLSRFKKYGITNEKERWLEEKQLWMDADQLLKCYKKKYPDEKGNIVTFLAIPWAELKEYKSFKEVKGTVAFFDIV